MFPELVIGLFVVLGILAILLLLLYGFYKIVDRTAETKCSPNKLELRRMARNEANAVYTRRLESLKRKEEALKKAKEALKEPIQAPENFK